MFSADSTKNDSTDKVAEKLEELSVKEDKVKDQEEEAKQEKTEEEKQ